MVLVGQLYQRVADIIGVCLYRMASSSPVGGSLAMRLATRRFICDVALQSLNEHKTAPNEGKFV